MAKNEKKKGKSARNGNAPSPYTKHGKVPYRYSAAYYDWKRGRVHGKVVPISKGHKARVEGREFKEAAE